LSREQKQRIHAALTGAKVEPPLSDAEKRHLREIKQIVGRRSAERAALALRGEEDRRLREIRHVVLNSVNNVPFKVDNVVEGGPILTSGDRRAEEGVVIGQQTRLGQVGISRPERDAQGNVLKDGNGNVYWIDEDDKVQGIVLMRKNQETLPALKGVKDKLDEL